MDDALSDLRRKPFIKVSSASKKIKSLRINSQLYFPDLRRKPFKILTD